MMIEPWRLVLAFAIVLLIIGVVNHITFRALRLVMELLEFQKTRIDSLEKEIQTK